MAERRTCVYTTETVMKFWNRDDVEEDCSSCTDDLCPDETEGIELGDFTHERDSASEFCEHHQEVTGSIAEQSLLSDVSLARSDVLFASSGEEDEADSDSHDECILGSIESVGHSEGNDSEQAISEDDHYLFDMQGTHHDSDRDSVSNQTTLGGISDSSSDESIAVRSRAVSRGRARGRRSRGGRAVGRRGRGQRPSPTMASSRGRGSQSVSRGRTGRQTSYRDLIPPGAVPITVSDANHSAPPEFNPMRQPGPHLPPGENPTSELDYFQLFFNDEVLDNLVTATNAYADDKKDQLKSMYRRFKLKLLTRDEMLAYIGVLIHLGINKVRNYKQVWNIKSSQYMPKLTSLMTRHRFEAIASFLHVVTKEEEATYGNNPLKKIYPLHEAIRKRSLDLYQPLQQLSIDERMVKSKARSHLRQYIRNKPTKWGFKYWIIADVTGYTIDFSLYGGSHHTEARSGKGLGYDVVMNLLQPFTFQGYQLYCDNFYSSPTLFEDLQSVEIAATGTLQKNRRGVPASVKQIHEALSRSDVPRGTGYYIREKGITYVSWKDNKCVTVISTAHPGSSECTAKRWMKGANGVSVAVDVPQPSAVQQYNLFMGGVDKSDQYLQYHRILRQTKKYWKTLFYHTIEIAVTNAFLLHQWQRMTDGKHRITENTFRDSLVTQLHSYLAQADSTSSEDSERNDATSMDITTPVISISHGSRFFTRQKRCAICSLKTTRRCPDCTGKPPLCQTPNRDCHSRWHGRHGLKFRKTWQKLSRMPHASLKENSGRPKGSRNKKEKRKLYRTKKRPAK